MKVKCIFVFLFMSVAFSLSSQNTRLYDISHFLYEGVFADDPDFHLSIQPFLVSDIQKADSLHSLNYSGRFSNRILNEAMIEIESNIFQMRINPIIDAAILSGPGEDQFLSDLKGGAGIGISFKNKIFLSFDYFLARSAFPLISDYVMDSCGIVPHYGKAISLDENNYLFQSFTGELSYRTSDYLTFHIGNGKHFFGNGYRSLFLSDNSNSYPYFKVTADIWKIKYVWMAAKMKDIQLTENNLDLILYDKAVFLHYFSLNVTKRFNFDFFESVITNPYDQKGIRSGYELSYVNPVIFYRPVEFYNGTSDNSLMGLGLNFRLFQSVHLYSQFILDDLIISRINDGSGWWGNKYGLQAGLKAYNFLNLDGLFFRSEVNLVRPYTYSHGQADENNDISNLNYGNYVQALAHPLDANFIEGIAQIKYIKGRFIAEMQLNIAQKGIDADSVSYGGNIYKSYKLRPDDYNISFLQGTKYNFVYAKAGASYILNPSWGLMFDAFVQYRDISAFNEEFKILFGIGLSTKIFNERRDYF